MIVSAIEENLVLERAVVLKSDEKLYIDIELGVIEGR